MYCVGQAKDIHLLAPIKSHITLGGYSFLSKYKIIAHSDGDVILHAIANALLGASQNGDIGLYFPDNDPKNKNISSLKIVNFVLNLLKNKWKIINLDLTVFCDKIMLNPFRSFILNSLKKIIHIPLINLKATRFEQNKLLIACEAVVLLEKKNK